jgi:hypothetical protein
VTPSTLFAVELVLQSFPPSKPMNMPVSACRICSGVAPGLFFRPWTVGLPRFGWLGLERDPLLSFAMCVWGGGRGGEQNVASRGRQDDRPPPTVWSCFCRVQRTNPTTHTTTLLGSNELSGFKGSVVCERRRGVAAGGSREMPCRDVRFKFKFKSPWAGHCCHVAEAGARGLLWLRKR